MYLTLTLKKSRLPLISARHPWIYRTSLEHSTDKPVHGDVVTLRGPDETILATGHYSAHSIIALRVLSWGEQTIDHTWLARRIERADRVRRDLRLASGPESGYRVVYGECDGLPGLVIDRYGDSIVFQIATAGVDRFRPHILEIIRARFSPRLIVERSDLATRREEHLDEVVTVHEGDVEALPRFAEDGIRFLADPLEGQKTGFFLDQRPLRARIRQWSHGRRVLNLFSYTGGFTLSALMGGAASVIQVDSSERALAVSRQLLDANGLAEATVESIREDVFQWLSPRREPEYDLVILDPPALIKSRDDFEAGLRGYHFLNRAALRLVRDGGLFVTSSCSTYLTEPDFQGLLARTSRQANVQLQIVERLYQGADHPITPEFPESAYLKSFVAVVHR